MAEKKNNLVWLFLLGIVAIIYFFGGSTTIAGSNGKDVSNVSLADDPAIKIHLADKNMNPLTQGTQLSNTQSTVVVKEGANQIVAYYNAFFMRFDVKATNIGALSNKVTLLDVAITDNNGVEIQSKAVSDAFQCILNKPQVIPKDQSYTWSTDADNPATGCSSLVWLQTPQFEKNDAGATYAQPLHIVVTVQGEFGFFNILKKEEKKISLDLLLTPGDIELGAYNLGLVGGAGSAFIDECKLTPTVETQTCPGSEYFASSCYNSVQSCTSVSDVGGEVGLWPGCTSTNYDGTYVQGKEINGGLAACKDGKDNDCDGFGDKAGITTATSCTTAANCPNPDTMTCVANKCTIPRDFDCPSKLTKFRTNAAIQQTGDVLSAYVGKWIAIDSPSDGLVTASLPANRDKDGKLESFGYISSAFSSTASCASVSKCNDNLAVSPTGALIVGEEAGYLYLCEATDLNSNGKCDYLKFSSGASTRCSLVAAAADFPECLNIEPTYPYLLNGQEKSEDY